MKRIVAIFFSLLIAVAPALALVPVSPADAPDACESCACEAMACCAESSDSESPEQPAAPFNGGKRQLSPALEQPASLGLALPGERNVAHGPAFSASLKSSAAPLYVWNCAYLI